MKEEIRKVVVGSDFFQGNNKGHTDDTQVSLRATLLCLRVPFRMTGWTYPPSVVFTLEQQ